MDEKCDNSRKFDKLFKVSDSKINRASWKSSLSDVRKYLQNPKCKGKHLQLDCEKDEITNEEVAEIFRPIGLSYSSNSNNFKSEDEKNQIQLPIKRTILIRHSLDNHFSMPSCDKSDNEITNLNVEKERESEQRYQATSKSGLAFEDGSINKQFGDTDFNQLSHPTNFWEGPNNVNKRQLNNEFENHPPLFKHSNVNSRHQSIENSSFRTGTEELEIRYEKRYGFKNGQSPSTDNPQLFVNETIKKSLGARRNVKSKFVLPIQEAPAKKFCSGYSAENTYTSNRNSNSDIFGPNDDLLKGIDPKMVTLIQNEIMHKFTPVGRLQ